MISTTGFEEVPAINYAQGLTFAASFSSRERRAPVPGRSMPRGAHLDIAPDCAGRDSPPPPALGPPLPIGGGEGGGEGRFHPADLAGAAGAVRGCAQPRVTRRFGVDWGRRAFGRCCARGRARSDPK